MERGSSWGNRRTCVVGGADTHVVVDAVHAGGIVLTVVVFTIIRVDLTPLSLKAQRTGAALGVIVRDRISPAAPHQEDHPGTYWELGALWFFIFWGTSPCSAQDFFPSSAVLEMGCWGLNQRKLHARQMPFLMNYSSSPMMELFYPTPALTQT